MQIKPQMVEAVLFFNEGGICKEMLFPEFEAVLDGVVNLREFADQQMRAAYVLIDPRLHIRAAVLFYIDFNDDGSADKGWNIPLRNLAERTGRGPDLGAGPIRLACRSQCPVTWHQMHLWDPNQDGETSKVFSLLVERVKRNQLGLLVEEEAPTAVPAERLQMVAVGCLVSARGDQGRSQQAFGSHRPGAAAEGCAADQAAAPAHRQSGTSARRGCRQAA